MEQAKFFYIINLMKKLDLISIYELPKTEIVIDLKKQLKHF